MNKKIILLPFLAVALLTGCGNKPGEKKPWEEELTEGESTIAEVKAGTVGEYYKVRGTVVWNSGSTLAIYRNGEFLYCYNFSSDTSKTSNEDLGEHALGSYVELYGQTSEYQNSIQLTAYVDSKYDVDAKCTTIAEVGEEVTPVAVNTADGLKNNVAAGMLAKIELVADADYTIPSTALSNNLDMSFKMTDSANTALTVRVEKYLPAEDIANLAGTINQGDKLEIVGVLAATSTNQSCRMVLGQGSSYTVKEAKQWAEPTSVTVTSEGSATTVKVNETLQLSAAVAPADAKQKVTWSSSDETKATVDATGKVTGVAQGSVVITATAKEGVAGTFNVTVAAADTNMITLSPATLLGYSSTNVAYSETAATKEINGVTFSYVQCGAYGSGIQIRIKNDVASEIHNTTAFASAIDHIEVNLLSTKTVYDNTGCFSFFFGTTAAPAGNEVKMNTVASTFAYTVTPTVTDATFFTFKLNQSNTFYIDSLVIVLK